MFDLCACGVHVFQKLLESLWFIFFCISFKNKLILILVNKLKKIFIYANLVAIAFVSRLYSVFFFFLKKIFIIIIIIFMYDVDFLLCMLGWCLRVVWLLNMVWCELHVGGVLVPCHFLWCSRC